MHFPRRALLSCLLLSGSALPLGCATASSDIGDAGLGGLGPATTTDSGTGLTLGEAGPVRAGSDGAGPVIITGSGDAGGGGSTGDTGTPGSGDTGTTTGNDGGGTTTDDGGSGPTDDGGGTTTDDSGSEGDGGACTSCLESTCASEITACQNDSTCPTCVTDAENGTSLPNSCNSNTAFNNFANCVDSSCTSLCGSDDGGAGEDSGGGGGGVPTTCDQAGGSTGVGCCNGDAVYYCTTSDGVGSSTCGSGKICSWKSSSSSETGGEYDCVSGTTQKSDPSGTYPIDCE